MTLDGLEAAMDDYGFARKCLPKHDSFGSPIAYDAHKFGATDRAEFPIEQGDEKDFEVAFDLKPAIRSDTGQPMGSTECDDKDEKCEEVDSDDEETEVTEEMVEGVTFRAKQGKDSSGAPIFYYDNSGRRYQADQFHTRIMRCTRPPDYDSVSWGKMD